MQQQLLRRALLDILMHHLAQDYVQLAHQNLEDPAQSSFHRLVECLPRRRFHGGWLWQRRAQSQDDILDRHGLPEAGQAGGGFGQQLANQNAPRNLRFSQCGDALLQVRQRQLQPEKHHLNRPLEQAGGAGLPGRCGRLHRLAQLHKLAHACERASRAELRPGIAQRVADVCGQNPVIDIERVLDHALHDDALVRVVAILAAPDALQHLCDGGGGIFRRST